MAEYRQQMTNLFSEGCRETVIKDILAKKSHVYTMTASREKRDLLKSMLFLVGVIFFLCFPKCAEKINLYGVEQNQRWVCFTMFLPLCLRALE